MAFGWDDDTDPQVRQTIDDTLLRVVVPSVVESAIQRESCTHALACRWHKEMLQGIPVDPPQAAGGIRDPTWFPGEVEVNGLRGMPTAKVRDEIARFDRTFPPRVSSLDGVVLQGAVPADARQVDDALALAADLHGEWVRIHPFVNGNGRTARLWCNWALVRYGIRPLMAPTPRPGWGPSLMDPRRDRYEYAAMQSMSVGNHSLMRAELKRRYRNVYGA